MIVQYTISSTEWTAISAAGQSCSVILDQQDDGASGAMDVRVIGATSMPSASDFTKARRIFRPSNNENGLLFNCPIGMTLYGRCKDGSAIVSVDSSVGIPPILQTSYSKDAVLTTTYQDDYIAKGNAYQVQRRITSIPTTGTYKIVLDLSSLSSAKVAFILPINMSATGGPVYIKTYKITTYTGGTAFPTNKLNTLTSNTNTAQGVVKHGITSTDIAGDDLREYELGATGNPQQVNRSGGATGAAPLIVPAGTKICLEIDNNYTDVISFTLGLVWYEI